MNEMVTIPREEYERLRAAADDLADLQTYDRAKAALAAGEDELIPADYVNRLLNGENALRVYRDLRAMTQAALAEKSGCEPRDGGRDRDRSQAGLGHDPAGLGQYARRKPR